MTTLISWQGLSCPLWSSNDKSSSYSSQDRKDSEKVHNHGERWKVCVAQGFKVRETSFFLCSCHQRSNGQSKKSVPSEDMIGKYGRTNKVGSLGDHETEKTSKEVEFEEGNGSQSDPRVKGIHVWFLIFNMCTPNSIHSDGDENTSCSVHDSMSDFQPNFWHSRKETIDDNPIEIENNESKSHQERMPIKPQPRVGPSESIGVMYSPPTHQRNGNDGKDVQYKGG